MDELELNNYKASLKDELTTLRFQLRKKLEPYHSLYQAMSTNDFYRKCSFTHSALYSLPNNFPKNLKVADSPQIAAFYSNLSRTCLLFSSGYSSGLKDSSEVKSSIFLSSKVDEMTLLENRIELYKYLNAILNNTIKYVKKGKSQSTLYSPKDIINILKDHEARLLKLEGGK